LGEKKAKKSFSEIARFRRVEKGIRLQNGRNANNYLVANKAKTATNRNSRTADLMVRPRLPLMEQPANCDKLSAALLLFQLSLSDTICHATASIIVPNVHQWSTRAKRRSLSFGACPAIVLTL